MKKRTQLILSAVAAVGLASTAQASYVNGDLLVGFTSSGANDYIFDVGSLSGLYYGETWALGADLGGDMTSAQFGNASWGVVGSLNSSQTIYSSGSPSGGPTEVVNGVQTVRVNVQSIGNNWSGTNNVNLAVTPGRTTFNNSWYEETDQPNGTPGNYFFNNLGNPNSPTWAQNYLYANDNLGDPAGAQGVFRISADGGTLTYVPEPGTFSILGGFGLLALRFRRQLIHKA